jgi:Beige/BEACH domain
MQGGRFDHADRLFFSLPHAWHQALTNTSDVKEMIPDLFCQPACLTNREGLELGQRQAGGSVGDVVLPPWAKGSPDEFIRIHRCVLRDLSQIFCPAYLACQWPYASVLNKA